MSENKDSSHDGKSIFRGRNPPSSLMTASEFINMNDGKLLEHYLRTNNSTALQKIRPRLSGEGKVTTPMMVAELGSSIDFLQAPGVNPTIRGGCGNYLPLLYFNLSCGGNPWCAKCLRAFINREDLTTTGKCQCSLEHAPDIFMLSDLDKRYRAQQSSNYHSSSFSELFNTNLSVEGASRSIGELRNRKPF